VVAEVSIEVDDVDAAHDAAVAWGAAIVHPLTDEAWGVRPVLRPRPRRACAERPEPPLTQPGGVDTLPMPGLED
jgi:hypothetical protein